MALLQVGNIFEQAHSRVELSGLDVHFITQLAARQRASATTVLTAYNE